MATNCAAVLNAKTKPEQAEFRSKPPALCAPMLSWMWQAVDGKGRSGVVVAQIIRSISAGSRLASSVLIEAGRQPHRRRKLQPSDVDMQSGVLDLVER